MNFLKRGLKDEGLKQPLVLHSNRTLKINLSFVILICTIVVFQFFPYCLSASGTGTYYSKIEPHNKNFQEICSKDLIEEFVMTFTSMYSNTTSNLSNAQTYLLEVTGTYNYSIPNLVDAAYRIKMADGSFFMPPIPFEDHAQKWQWNGTGDIRPDPDVFDGTAHTYKFPFMGDGTSQVFTFMDNLYSDNGGSLTFKLYRITEAKAWFADVDGDGYGDANSIITSCEQPEGYVINSSDDCPYIYGLIGDSCDDRNPNTIGEIINSECECFPSEYIPTLSQWSLVILTLCLFVIGVVSSIQISDSKLSQK